MPQQTPRGYPLFDPTGADVSVRGLDYLNSMVGNHESGFTKMIDREMTELNSSISELQNKENIISITATYVSTINDTDYYIGTADIDEYQDKSILLVEFNKSNTGKVSININDLGTLDIQKINNEGVVVDVQEGDISLNTIYLFQIRLETEQVIFIGKDYRDEFISVEEALDSITTTLKSTVPGQVLASTETEPGVFVPQMRALELDDLPLVGKAGGLASLGTDGLLRQYRPRHRNIVIDVVNGVDKQGSSTYKTLAYAIEDNRVYQILDISDILGTSAANPLIVNTNIIIWDQYVSIYGSNASWAIRFTGNGVNIAITDARVVISGAASGYTSEIQIEKPARAAFASPFGIHGAYGSLRIGTDGNRSPAIKNVNANAVCLVNALGNSLQGVARVTLDRTTLSSPSGNLQACYANDYYGAPAMLYTGKNVVLGANCSAYADGHQIGTSGIYAVTG